MAVFRCRRYYHAEDYSEELVHKYAEACGKFCHNFTYHPEDKFEKVREDWTIHQY